MLTKKKTPEAIRQQVWLLHIGKKFESKCLIKWCSNNINVFNYHTGHNIPRSKGGTNDIDNLLPICSNCNLSMGSTSINDWNNTSKKHSCFRRGMINIIEWLIS